MSPCGKILFAVLVSLIAVGCGGRHRDVTVVKLGHVLDISHPVHHAMVYMAEKVAEKSGGRMRIDIYPSRQLGSERELLELLQIGSLGNAKTTTMVLEGFSPSYEVFTMPYLFRDREHYFNVLEGEVGKKLLLECQDFWLRGLCYYDSGSRSFYTKDKAIRTPDDLKGLKIRTPESPTALKTVNLLGGSATPIAWGELYSALQQRVVDGAENNPPTLYTSRQFEVCRFYTLDEHITVPDILVVGVHIWERLTAEEQNWLQEAALESYRFQKEIWQQASEEALEEIRQAGVEVIIPDKALFREKMLPLYEEYMKRPELSALIAQIQDTE